MTAPTTMPAIAPELRLRLLLSVDWLVEERGCVVLMSISVDTAEVVEEDVEDKNVEIELKEAEFEANEVEVERTEVESTEMLGTDDSKDLEILFN